MKLILDDIKNDPSVKDFYRSRNYQRYFTSHKLRKLFTTTLYNEGVDHYQSTGCLGHRINPITEPYFKNDPSKLKSRYIQAAKKLEKLKITVTTNEYDQILRDSKEKDDKIMAMEKRMELMDTMLKEMMQKQLETKP